MVDGLWAGGESRAARRTAAGAGARAGRARSGLSGPRRRGRRGVPRGGAGMAGGSVSGAGGQCPAARMERGYGLEEGIREFREGGVYIGIEGARNVQMRCGFRPHDRDQTTEMMEEF